MVPLMTNQTNDKVTELRFKGYSTAIMNWLRFVFNKDMV